MFRIRFALGFVVIVLLQAAFAYFALHSKISPLIEADADLALERSAALAETAHRLGEFSLVEKARFVARRPDLRRAMIEDYEGDAEYERHVNVHRLLERDQIRFTEFMAPRNEGVRNLDLDLMNRRPANQEIFMALDETGRGVATLGKDLAHWMGDNVAADFPVVLDVMASGETILDVWNWSWRSGDDKQLYSVAIAPMRSPEGSEIIGAVILGNLINDGVAQSIRSLITDGPSGESSTKPGSREAVQAPEVAFFRGNRIYSSTLRTQQVQQLSRELFENKNILEKTNGELHQAFDFELGNASYRGIVRLFAGQEGTPNPAGLVVIINQDEIMAPLEQAKKNTFFIAGVLLILGLILIGVFFYIFLRPFEALEDGVQSIISGDKEHVFGVQSANPVANGLAHHLNLLSAYLQGKPMPDDDAPAGGGWDDLGGATTSAPAQEGPKPAMAGVPMGLGRKKDTTKKSEEESAEETT